MTQLLPCPLKLSSSSYLIVGWPCVCSMRPRMLLSWTDLVRCLATQLVARMPARKYLMLLVSPSFFASSSPAASLCWRFAARISKASQASNLSPSIVPTKRPFRPWTHSTNGVFGRIQPFNRDLPSYCARTSTLNSTRSSTTSHCAAATAWKSGAGIGGGVASSVQFSHFVRISADMSSRMPLSWATSGFFCRRSSLNGLISKLGMSPMLGVVPQGSSSKMMFCDRTRLVRSSPEPPPE
mmetsp:Transcript_64610/g.187221  ORF Transcript_64610/g.187221 Transcript_64610/m.187221 type:complete len:239 (-) Transcript_64610:45-761(-)